MSDNITINDSLSRIATDRTATTRLGDDRDPLAALGDFGAVLRSKQGNANVLAGRQDAATDRTDSSDRDKVRDAAQKLVSSSFVLPLLAQMRNSAFKSDLMRGGKGEDAFGAQLDTIIADRVVESGNFNLVDQIEKQLMKRGSMNSGASSRIAL